MAGRDPGSRNASVKDVAAAAGVSLGTVSNVLNRPDRVSPDTRERVLRAMAELGFVRNESARQLRAGSSRTLAYVMLDASNPFFIDIAQGIDTAAEAVGLSLVLCNSRSLAEREQSHLALLEQQRVQGILITPVDPDAASLDDVARRGTPVVLVDRTRADQKFCSVAVDDVLGGQRAVEHLIDRGHTRVAFVGGPTTLGPVRDRWRGAQDAWAAAGLPAEGLVEVTTTGLTVAEGREAGQRLAGMPAPRRPTAAFCANDLTALGLLQQATSSGLRVPEELALVGYDDIDFAGAAAVPLTSVRQPRQELGCTAAELVLDEATNPEHTHRQVLFTPELVARASTLG
ncbi:MULTISPECIES: LacI family DNA-binding transcriptional regulator [unclassified Nocardioides]|uniref:LacI family DNA-binding transcriptional regulator n=1 Tax=unclassified Nocardioides TaxID=2615069 RepID=UPI0009F03287|nr:MULTISPECIES: LacI family DNA-binding transcriptional regulator [unclassified Nocardioides]GAW50360.1 LacI family transcriptional regulator [Nocardioides sp. PD653-B2]GAW53082.1 LacI family transcriptional regulator [Nocardioides sp. PD653]